MTNDLARIKRDIGNLYPSGGVVHRLVQEIEDLREAAEELREACIWFEREISSRLRKGDAGLNDMSEDLRRVVLKARAAIAKAEGRP